MPRLKRKSRHLWSPIRNKEVTKEQLNHANIDFLSDVQIKTEVLDVEESTDTSMHDITVETHESIEELKRILNLPDTRIHREPIIKSEEPYFNTSSLLHEESGFSNSKQSTAGSCTQHIYPSDISQSSRWTLVTKDNTSVPVASNLLDQNIQFLRQKDHNTSVIKCERNLKCPMVEISPMNDVESDIGTNKVCRIESDHPFTRVCSTSLSIAGCNISESQASFVRGSSRHCPAIKKEALKESIRRHHHIAMKKNNNERNDLTLNIPYFKSINYDPDLNFLLSLMPFLNSLSPSLRAKAKAQIKEIISEPQQ